MAALESGSKPEPRELGNVIILTKCANALGCALIFPTTKDKKLITVNYVS